MHVCMCVWACVQCKMEQLPTVIVSYWMSVILFHWSICHILFQFNLLDFLHWSICHILFQFKLLVLFHWSKRHILLQFNLLTLCIHLLIHCYCLLLFFCVWCWLRATSLLVPPADADSESMHHTESPVMNTTSEQTTAVMATAAAVERLFVWSRSKNQVYIIIVLV